MANIYNIYCDESCHLENDRLPVMGLGAIWCPENEVEAHSKSLRRIKEKHKSRGELKWTKVSKSRDLFFEEIVDYFFMAENLMFRCLLVDDKSKLDHSYFNKGSHDSFYYKMYYYLLRNIIVTKNKYFIYVDIKDTRSQIKIDKLKNVLSNYLLDFEYKTTKRIQHIRSNESELLQLTDFFLGAMCYNARDLEGNKTKLRIVKKLSQYCKCNLSKSTPPWEEKFNIFVFSPVEVNP